MSTLTVKHLEKKYRKPVVKNISLCVTNDKIIGLLGPNGAGKTTAFDLIVGLITKGQGQIFLNNQDITKLSMHERARLGIGYLPQENSIFRKLTVRDNIMAILELRKNLKKREKIALMERLLKEFHIEHLRDNIGINLSGGEKRRVEIARALAMEPKFMLLDEPFAGIDPISIIEIKKIIITLNRKNIGILITDHNVREALSICHHAYIVNEGKIIAKGTTQEIMSNEIVRKVYLGDEFIL